MEIINKYHVINFSADRNLKSRDNTGGIITTERCVLPNKKGLQSNRRANQEAKTKIMSKKDKDWTFVNDDGSLQVRY